MIGHDVVIVGAGPAGSMAAYTLARKGWKVALLDKAVFPRNKLCGGLLTWKTIQLLESAFNIGLSELGAAEAITRICSSYTIHAQGKIVANGSLPYPFHLTDRCVLDELLLNRAREDGAEVHEGVAVRACYPSSGVVRMKDGNEYSGRFIIGADSVNSIVRSSFPKDRIDRSRWKKNLAAAIEVTVPQEQLPQQVDNPQLHVGFLDAGYGWVFPGREKAVIGICGLKNKKINLNQIFKKYLEYLEIEKNSEFRSRGYPLPYGNYLEHPCYGRTVLAGDAAGFVEPLLGEGIFFALASGLYAAEAVSSALKNDVSPAENYEKKLVGQLFPEFRGADRIRWALFGLMNLLGAGSITTLFSLAGSRLAETVHGMRSYEWTNRKKWDFMSDHP